MTGNKTQGAKFYLAEKRKLIYQYFFQDFSHTHTQTDGRMHTLTTQISNKSQHLHVWRCIGRVDVKLIASLKVLICSTAHCTHKSTIHLNQYDHNHNVFHSIKLLHHHWEKSEKALHQSTE